MDQSVGKPITRLRVIGAGVMGTGIAQLAVSAGLEVELADQRSSAPGAARERIAAQLERGVEKGRMTAADASAALDRLHLVEDPFESAEVNDLVIEAVQEDLAVKHSVFTRLEETCTPETVLATNTSSLSVTAIAAALRNPERLAGLHFFNPVPLMRLAEIVPGARTDPAVVGRLRQLVDRLGHSPVIAADSPGFVVNHAGRGLVTEGLQILDEGTATVEDIDRISRDVLGLRMGPFELLDLTGLDVSHPVLESIWSGFYNDPRLRPSPTTRTRMAAGLLGRKSGVGFYSYQDGIKQESPEFAPPPYEGEPIWTNDVRLSALLQSAGVEVETRPEEAEALLVVPSESSAKESARAAGLEVTLSSGVDPFGDFEGRLTLAVHPSLTPVAARLACAALGRLDNPLSVVRDAPVPVAQRLLASIVNTSCEIAQRRLALPADIDVAVKLALGYPRGPLAWGDEVGAEGILGMLTAMHSATGDPRYRPSRWLTDRAGTSVGLAQTGLDPADLVAGPSVPAGSGVL